jgi:hypothetical protein
MVRRWKSTSLFEEGFWCVLESRKSQAGWLTPVILRKQRSGGSQFSPRQVVCKTLSQENPSEKGLEECLPSKCEALISNPSAAPQKESRKS